MAVIRDMKEVVHLRIVGTRIVVKTIVGTNVIVMSVVHTTMEDPSTVAGPNEVGRNDPGEFRKKVHSLDEEGQNAGGKPH